MKKFFIVVLAAIAASGISCSTSEYTNIQVSLPDLSGKNDGTYRGEQNFSGTPIHVILDVALHNHRIASVTVIKHSCSPIGKKAEKIIAKIIDKQSLDIDTVSGATVSSKAIMKAVENALE